MFLFDNFFQVIIIRIKVVIEKITFIFKDCLCIEFLLEKINRTKHNDNLVG